MKKSFIFLCLIIITSPVISFQVPNEPRDVVQELVDLAYTLRPDQLSNLPVGKRHNVRLLQQEIRNIRQNPRNPSNPRSINDFNTRQAIMIIHRREMPLLRNPTAVPAQSVTQQANPLKKEKLP